MATKPSPKTLKNKADQLFSRIVRARGECHRCRRRPPEVVLHCSHIMSRKYVATRWDEDNAQAICQGCHFWQHANPAENALFLISSVGEDKLADLRERAISYPGRIARVSYEEIVERLKRRLAEEEAA